MSNDQYNVTVAPLWTTKGGNYSFSLNEENLSELRDAINGFAPGGKLLVKIVSEKSRSKETSPHAYLEYMDPAKVRAFAAERKSAEESVI